VHEFRPAVPYNSMFTSKCNGVATDPYRGVLISPFVSDTMDPQLGMWSLYSDDYIGSKPLAQGLDDASKQYMNIELCKTRTAAWRRAIETEDILPAPELLGLYYKLAHWEEENEYDLAAATRSQHVVIYSSFVSTGERII
jgi:hypothetical protein